MATQMYRLVRQWLESEGAGSADEADERFRAVARTLESPRLPSGFTAAVLARIGVGPARADVFAAWWVRAGVAAGVLLVGGAGAFLPWHAWTGALTASLQGVAWGLGRLLAGGEAWVASGLALWAGLAGASTVVGRQLLGPVPVMLLGLNFVIAAVAFGALRRLMALQEN